MMHIPSSGTDAPGATGSHGTRYDEPVIFAPSCSTLRTVIRSSHLPQTDPGQPPHTSLSGWPFRRGMSSPFIDHAISDSFFEGFCDRHTARDRRFVEIAARMDVRAVVPDVDGVFSDADVVEHIFQPRSGPLRATHGAHGPLVPRRRGHEFAAPVAPAFELNLVGVGFELLLELPDGKTLLPATPTRPRFQGPRVRVDVDRGSSVVAHEEVLRGVIRSSREMRRCFCIERLSLSTIKPPCLRSRRARPIGRAPPGSTRRASDARRGSQRPAPPTRQ